MIPVVAFQDALWFVMVFGLWRTAPTRTTRRLAQVMLCYVALEFFAHVAMENVVAQLVFSRWL